MKKVLFLFTAIAAISFVACKKDRVCECTVGQTTFKYTLNDAKKRQAKDICVSYSEDNGNGTTTKYDCTLKK